MTAHIIIGNCLLHQGDDLRGGIIWTGSSLYGKDDGFWAPHIVAHKTLDGGGFRITEELINRTYALKINNK